jgi:hypothetical protein
MSNIDFEEFQRDIDVAESYLKESSVRHSADDISNSIASTAASRIIRSSREQKV